jgi:hypothetical protein
MNQSGPTARNPDDQLGTQALFLAGQSVLRKMRIQAPELLEQLGLISSAPLGAWLQPILKTVGRVAPPHGRTAATFWLQLGSVNLHPR